MQTIKINAFNKSFGINEILHNISLQINTGEKYGLVGANGTGKTTFLNLLAGFDTDFTGTITGAVVNKIGLVKQQPVFPENLLVKEIFLYEYNTLIRSLAGRFPASIPENGDYCIA